MFGYVNINNSELKMKDYYKYKAYYCGLCKTLKNRHGTKGQMTLSYDMTFLVILLTSLYESNTIREQNRCVIHPVKKHDTLSNEITEYVADMNIALTYHHFLDDWQDDKSIVGLSGAKLLNKSYKKVREKHPRQCEVIRDSLTKLQECEKNNDINIDMVSRPFGELMSELFVYKSDMWEESLRRIGFFLGKYIYILDAYDDIEKDIEKGSYNPLKHIYKTENFELNCRNMLTMMIAECSNEFEKLPLLWDIDILRNILYEGVWTKFEKISNDRNEKEGQKNDCKSISNT